MGRTSLTILLLICAGAATAQQPLSAIDWLDRPSPVPGAEPAVTTMTPVKPADEPPVSASADVPGVAVTPLGQAIPDSVGLLPTATTGLPRSLWRMSQSGDLIAAISDLAPDTLPAAQALIYTLLLAEADAPMGLGNDAGFLKARVNALKSFGAVDPARALLERAGPDQPGLFDLWLDLSLLSGDEDKPCAVLRERPILSQNYAARVYCISRAGDWETAALTLGTAIAIGALDDRMADLLTQFLDPEMIEDDIGLPPPGTPDPLVFRLFEAIGAPLPTRSLPHAYAMADLRGVSGWKAELEAAERLARTGALPATRLLGLYTDRAPAASGSVWDRVRAVQALDRALFARDGARVADTLPVAWEAARTESLAVPFAQLFASRLMEIDLPDTIRQTAFHVALLSPEYERAAAHFASGLDARDARLAAIATGAITGAITVDGQEDAEIAAILDGFAATAPSERHAPLLEAGKLGEAILAAASDLGRTDQGGMRLKIEALKTLRAVGLEDAARRAALQMILLGPAR